MPLKRGPRTPHVTQNSRSVTMAANSSITFLAVDAEPDNNCDLSAPLKLTWRYKAAEDIPAGCNWVVTYVFDVVEHAREAHLGSVACEPTAGASVHDAEFSCDYIDASGLPERHVCACQLNQDCTLTRYALLQLSLLNNVGLLRLELRDAEGAVRACLSLVNQTARTGIFSGFSRSLIAPPLGETT